MKKAEVGRFSISPDEDSSSYSSNSDFNYSYPTKQAALKSHYVDVDPENQNFLLESNLGKKKYETDFHPGTTSFGMSVFNLSNAIVGSGILGLSYAMANTGIALFIILLTFVSIFSLYSVHLLLKTANEGGSLSYEQLGHKAFGMVGKLAASGSITMQNIGAMSSYLFIVKYELPLVIKALMNIEDTTGLWYLNGDYLVLLVSLLLILPLSLLKNLEKVESELLHTYSKVLGADILLLIVRLAVLMAVTLTVPVVIFPIRSSITQLFCPTKDFTWWRHGLITISILAFTNVLVIFVPTIRDIFGFIGCMVYEKLGEQVFGTTGKFVIFGATSLQNTGGYLGYTSGFSLSCMVFFLIVVIYKKFQIPCIVPGLNATSANSTNADMCTPKYVTFNSKTVYALPTIAFAFVCHPSVLPIYSELKDRSQKRMQMVSNISFFAMFLMYFLTAIFGYLTFYENVQSDLLHKYQSKDDVLILTVRVAVIVAVILTVPVLFFTVRSSLFELAKKTKFNLCRHIFVTIILLVIINLLVIFIPSMKDIFGVVALEALLLLCLRTCSELRQGQLRDWVFVVLSLGGLVKFKGIFKVVHLETSYPEEGSEDSLDEKWEAGLGAGTGPSPGASSPPTGTATAGKFDQTSKMARVCYPESPCGQSVHEQPGLRGVTGCAGRRPILQGYIGASMDLRWKFGAEESKEELQRLMRLRVKAGQIVIRKVWLLQGLLAEDREQSASYNVRLVGCHATSDQQGKSPLLRTKPSES
ncbi:Sodium-coupled neutral amino acid transporter 2 [Myotis davidii]|uniref:Sodium-coupled neutral amino acid transporter 2 n=1 Tax=Myotis davidii TaxID=225400 RepID=L5MCN1_MYODS|nr:Sodium-coupled neutral amino acid transporter 2 [Myotis davidii]